MTIVMLCKFQVENLGSVSSFSKDDLVLALTVKQ